MGKTAFSLLVPDTISGSVSFQFLFPTNCSRTHSQTLAQTPTYAHLDELYTAYTYTHKHTRARLHTVRILFLSL